MLEEAKMLTIARYQLLSDILLPRYLLSQMKVIAALLRELRCDEEQEDRI